MTKILLVEDNPLNLDMLSRRLTRSGFEVITATDGQQSIELARSALPDLILMDMSLPIMDGWEATRQLKADKGTQHIPIIALTAHAMAGDKQKTQEVGCDDYDTKPIDYPGLISKIEKLLSSSG